MGTLPEPRVKSFEEHFLACESCQDELLEMEAYVNAVRSVSPKLRGAKQTGWGRWLEWPRPVWIAATVTVAVALFLAKGWLGEPFEVHAVMSKVLDADSRAEAAPYPGGIMFELGCHVLDLVVGVLGRPTDVAGFNRHSAPLADGLLDNMLAVLTYPKATATVKATALEVEGFDRRHLVVCGTGGTFHVQPLDNPAARVSLSQARDGYKKGTQAVTFPKYTRYVGDAADMARVIRGEKKFDFTPGHDLAVQEALLRACGLPTRG